MSSQNSQDAEFNDGSDAGEEWPDVASLDAPDSDVEKEMEALWEKELAGLEARKGAIQQILKKKYVGLGKLAETKTLMKYEFCQFLEPKAIVMLGLLSQKFYFVLNSNTDKTEAKATNHFEFVLCHQYRITIAQLAELKQNMEKYEMFTSDHLARDCIYLKDLLEFNQNIYKFHLMNKLDTGLFDSDPPPQVQLARFSHVLNPNVVSAFEKQGALQIQKMVIMGLMAVNDNKFTKSWRSFSWNESRMGAFIGQIDEYGRPDGLVRAVFDSGFYEGQMDNTGRASGWGRFFGPHNGYMGFWKECIWHGSGY